MRFESGKYEVELVNDRMYSPGSAENVRSYSRVYDFAESVSETSSRHGLVLREDGVVGRSCFLIAGGGASGIHEHSAVIVGDRCFVAVGDTLCALGLPSLDLLWHRKIDTATCFGVYYSAKHDCLISHGELEIARVTLSGEVVWSAGGADIFSEGFKLFPDHVEVVDFNGAVYRFDITTGAS
jgi:hypothetical protein